MSVVGPPPADAPVAVAWAEPAAARAPAGPIVVAQLEPPSGPLRVPSPPQDDKTGQPAQPSQPAAVAHWPKPEIDLDMIRTRDISLLYFAPAETYLTPYVGRALENSMAFQEKIYGWKPWERTTVLLKDFSDYGNAGARATPNNTLLLDIAPLSQVFETLSAGERFFTLSNHELTHVATMDVWNSTDARWRRFFGGGKPIPLQEHPESILYSFLAAPRATSPRWYLEGSAVFMETWMAGGYGRAQGAYDEMVFRSMVRDHAPFFSPLGLEAEGTQIDFQVGVNDYLYGARFFSYLALTRSPEKVIQWLRRDEDSAPYYSVQFKKVFGAPLNDVWGDWITWEHGFEAANLASVQAFPITPTHRLTPTALGSVSRSFLDPASDSLIGGFRAPGVIANLGELSLETGRIRHLADIKGPTLYRVTSVAFDPDARTAWYTADNGAYRDLMQVDVASGHEKMLIRDGRIGDLVFNRKDKSLWGLRHFNGYVTLVRLPAPYTSWTQVHTFKYGQVLFDLDVSPDGELLSTSFGEVNADQSVRVYRLSELGDDEPKSVAEFRLGQSTPEGFVFSPDGKYLFGSAYYTGVSNLYRFELATQKVEAVSNAATGLFRPIPRADGSLIAFEYTGQGFAPVTLDPKPLDDLGSIKFLGAEVAAQHPIVKSWAVGSPARVPLDDMVTHRGKYVPLREMKLGAAYPVVEGYKRRFAFGWHAIFEDPLEFNQLTATLAYSPSNVLPQSERWHSDVEFHTLSWTFAWRHNDAGFYDLFGPTDRSRKGDAFSVGYKHPFVYDPPRQLDFSTELTVYRGLDTLPGAQNVSTGLDSNITAFTAGLVYHNTDKSLGAVDYERGVRWNLNFEDDVAEGRNFPQFHAGLDFGRPLGGKHVSLWLYNAVGVSGGDRANPLSSFYLGAFGNNYVDDGEVKRYREFDSMPGFRIDEISARSFAKSTVELNLPPLRFSNIGAPSLFLSSMRSAVFAGVLAAKPGVGPMRVLETAGAQVDWNFTVALRLPMVFSLGYALGFEHGERQHGEVMASLKIL